MTVKKKKFKYKEKMKRILAQLVCHCRLLYEPEYSERKLSSHFRLEYPHSCKMYISENVQRALVRVPINYTTE